MLDANYCPTAIQVNADRFDLLYGRDGILMLTVCLQRLFPSDEICVGLKFDGERKLLRY